MSEHLTEEEQLENLKRLWKEYGQGVVIASVVAVAGYLGFNGYQASERAAAEAASAQYQTLVETVAGSIQAPLTEAQITTAKTQASALKSDAPDNFYGQSAALFLAKLEIESGDLDAAVTELRWVLSQDIDAGIGAIASQRLARVLSAQGEHDAALAELAKPVAKAFKAGVAEVRGDVYLAKGDEQAARAAFQSAIDSLTPEDYNRRMQLQLKLDDVKVALIQPPAAELEQTQPADAKKSPESKS